MTDRNLGDRHSGYSAEPPYFAVTTTVRQTYQYSRNQTDWMDLTSVTITRTIVRTPQGGWEQLISTTLSSHVAIIQLPPMGSITLLEDILCCLD